MSTPNVEVLGTQVTATGAVPTNVAGQVSVHLPGGVAVHIPGVDVLAFTGTGPGTLPLAIIGLLTLVVGFAATVFGRRRHRAEPEGTPGPLRDLSYLARGALHDPA